MDTLLNKFNSKVNSVIIGFDRIVFKGIIKPIMHAAGMDSFLVARKVLNKDFKNYAMAQSKKIVDFADELSNKHFGHDVLHISSSNVRKETLAHERQKELAIKEGLIGIWSCVESCRTFKSTYNPTSPYPFLRRVDSKCKHLYFYFDDPVYGFMNVRLQTWAPYEIQIALNGREWLRRSLEKAGCGHYANGNKFLHIDDYELAQMFLDEQGKARFEDVLNGFLPSVFPHMAEVVGPGLSYYWTYWQTETAKDYIFEDSEALSGLMYDLQLHTLITGKGDRILKYFGSPVKKDGLPWGDRDPKISSRGKTWYNGVRVRHWSHTNSVKFYNEHNVLRVEMTMNDPTQFKIHRYAENQDKSEEKRFIPMRKGVADTAARITISRSIIDRFTEHMAAVEIKSRFGEVVASVTSPIINKGKRTRALDVFGKDKKLLFAIADPAFDVHAITNIGLQRILENKPWAKGLNQKQLSAKISRHLRILREHSIIKKLPKQRKYILTDKGCKLTAALEVASAASVNALLKLAA